MFLYPIQHPEEPECAADSWKCYALSEDEEGEQCEFLDKVVALGEGACEQFFAWLLHFKKLCAASPRKPIESIVNDDKVCHDVGTVTIYEKNARGKRVSKEHTVWQFRYKDLRVFWCYAGEGRVVLFGNIVEKRRDKTLRTWVEVAGHQLQILQNHRDSGTLRIVKHRDHGQTK